MKKAEGVVITKVDPDSVAAEKGLSEGFVILSVGKQPVKSVAEFRDGDEERIARKGNPAVGSDAQRRQPLRGAAAGGRMSR